MSAQNKTTPMMEQYRRIRRELPENTLLFFRLGDFYEMFMEDAVEAARILDITLTKRHDIPMCGVPYHSAEGYLARLIEAGKKVAICEQVEDPAAAKGIVKREVTRVVTPGAVLDETSLDRTKNNYLACLVRDGARFGMALLDLSTGAFWIEESASLQALSGNLARYMPQECIVAESAADDTEILTVLGRTLKTVCDDWTFDRAHAEEVLLRHFKVHSLKGFGCETCPTGLRAAGAALYYVSTTLRRNLAHVRRIQVKNPDDYLLLDETTVTNLELVTSLNPSRQGPKSTLLSVLDTTCTAMGARMLREWIIRPLCELSAIRARLDAVQAFTENRTLLAGVRRLLGEMRDLERMMSRLGSGGGNARDLRAVGESLGQLPPLKKMLAESGTFAALADSITELPELVNRINEAIDDEPSASVKEGGMIRRGFSVDLDELREAAGKGKQWLAEFQAAEQERTGIKSLKVRYNQVFGYFIEVTTSVPILVPQRQLVTEVATFL